MFAGTGAELKSCLRASGKGIKYWNVRNAVREHESCNTIIWESERGRCLSEKLINPGSLLFAKRIAPLPLSTPE